MSEDTPLAEICERTGLSEAVIYKWVKKYQWAYSPSKEKKTSKTIRATADVLRLVDLGIAAGAVDIKAIADACVLSTNSVRRIIQKHRQAEMDSLRTTVVTSKRCSSCGHDLPLSDFPERIDRIGKLHAWCFACRVDWSRRYRHDNPLPIREASRRRRARIRGSRTDNHKEHEVYERDQGLCCFCHKVIDPKLVHPDPLSLSINHLHPIAKRGPDVLKNVAPAHLICNRKAKDNYDPVFRSWAVAPITSAVAREAVVANHYLHRPPNISFAYGLLDDVGTLRGVVTFGSPSSMRISQSACDDPTKVIELNRLWIDDDAPFGLGSWFLSRALRQLPPFIVVSYADLSENDPRYGTAHEGGIYRACSFAYAGSSRPNVEWRLPGKTRNIGKQVEGAVQVQVSPKNRFWTVTGSKTEKKNLQTACKWPRLVPILDGDRLQPAQDPSLAL